MKKGSGGGAATHAGTDYQNRTQAWVCVQILAEATAPWGLPSDATLEFIRCETAQPVDDFFTRTSHDGIVFAQVKHKLNLESAEDSDFASALDQFVAQFLRPQDVRNQQLKRSLDHERDRLVLVTSPLSSQKVRHHLSRVCGRARSIGPNEELDSFAVNNEERATLGIVLKHVERSWQRQMSGSPTEKDIRQLFSLMQIQQLDVDEGGADEKSAKDLLRLSILSDPAQADSAWSKLIAACAGYSRGRSGADRNSLQKILTGASIQIRSVPSFFSDIQRLKKYSTQTAESLAEFAKIRVGEDEICIQRDSSKVLRDGAESGSLVVVGEPGAGKSGELYQLADALAAEGRDVVLLVVDRIEAASRGGLRSELQLDHDLTTLLENWNGSDPAFLIVDALDAARSEHSANTLRQLISDVVKAGSRWRVVASIRKFDLRYDDGLRRSFSGHPPSDAFRDREFFQVRHINIPRLTSPELDQVRMQSTKMTELIDRAQTDLREVMMLPFNLRLLADLLNTGQKALELTPIRTQIELLDRYWSERVLKPAAGAEDREGTLRALTESMTERRAMQANRTDALAGGTSGALIQLLSSHVLVEWQKSSNELPERAILAYSHHMLFDYAVARLLFRGMTDNFVNRLADDAYLSLAVRPSLGMHFQYEWHKNRDSFWEVVFRITQEDEIPLVGKLVGPTVAAESATRLDDVAFLRDALQNVQAKTRNSAHNALRHVCNAVLALPDPQIVLLGQDSFWCDAFEAFSKDLRPEIVGSITNFLRFITEHVNKLTGPQQLAVGVVARRLLKYAWSQSSPSKFLVAVAIRGVCRTFQTDSNASSEILRVALTTERLQNHGHSELFWLAQEIKCLVPVAPTLVEEIYRAAFQYQDLSDEATPMGSPVLPMSSSRRQDYNMGLFALAESFSIFLSSSVIEATRALVDVLEAYVSREHSHESKEAEEEMFEFGGQSASIRTDFSTIWDRDRASREDVLKMLDCWSNYLRTLCGLEHSEERAALLETIRKVNRLAAIWRRVIEWGAECPDTVGLEIRSLGWAVPIMTCIDTKTELGDYLKQVYPLLEPQDRETVERAVLSLEYLPGDRYKLEACKTQRDHFLCCVSASDLMTEEARVLRKQLDAEGGPPLNESSVNFSGSERPDTPDDSLPEQGVPVEAEGNRRVRELEKPVEAFASQYLNKAPLKERIAEAVAGLQALYEALQSANTEDVHPAQSKHAWGLLAEAGEAITRSEKPDCEDRNLAFVRKLLLEARVKPDPAHDPQYDEQFDRSQSWGSRSARISAARGLLFLARSSTCFTPDVLVAIEGLSEDPVPAVRYQVARGLTLLHGAAPELMWRVLERYCHEEPRNGVLRGVLHSLYELARVHGERIALLTKTILDRVIDGPGSKDVRDECVRLITGLFVRQDVGLCREILDRIVLDPAGQEVSLQIPYVVSDCLTIGPVNPADAQKAAVRQRAIDLVKELSHSTVKHLQELDKQYSGGGPSGPPPEALERYKSLATVADGISSTIYFESGVYEKQGAADPSKPTLTTEQRLRFFREIESVLDDLTNVGVPQVAHHLIETLESFIQFDPEGVFLKIARTIDSGRKFNYEFDSLAVNLFERIIERYLAEFRYIFREDGECQNALVRVLDAFVEAGWPKAHRLVYRFQDCFR